MQFPNEQLGFLAHVLLSDERIRKVLWVGHSPESNDLVIEGLLDAGKTITLMEPYTPHADHLRRMGYGEVVGEEILEFSKKHRGRPSFDFMVWAHGPHLVEWDEFLKAQKYFKKLVSVGEILQTPLGSLRIQPGDNPFDVLKAVLYPSMFLELGYSVTPHGRRHESTFSAVRYKKGAL